MDFVKKIDSLASQLVHPRGLAVYVARLPPARLSILSISDPTRLASALRRLAATRVRLKYQPR
jgi:hypothetical protein